MSSELTTEDVVLLALTLTWFDCSKWGRVVQDDSQKCEVIRHSGWFRNLRNRKVIYSAEFSREQRYNHIVSACEFMNKTGANSLGAERDNILSLRANLSSEYGAEGAKRYSELSYVAFKADDEFLKPNDREKASVFWANFRTFLDVERATSIGHPFRIEHYLGIYEIINDAQGARIKHASGPTIKLSHLLQMARSHRGGF